MSQSSASPLCVAAAVAQVHICNEVNGTFSVSQRLWYMLTMQCVCEPTVSSAVRHMQQCTMLVATPVGCMVLASFMTQ